MALLVALVMSITWSGTVHASTQTAFINRGTFFLQGGYGNTTECLQSGVDDVAVNRSTMKDMVPYCSANRTLPSGWLGDRAAGYMNGSFCARSSWRYSDVAATAWSVWVWACSNPAGTQGFYTIAEGKLWVNTTYDGTGELKSPTAQY